ncbi:GMC oxidoreductase-domain-containing protein [Suillus occidentalis]|nr:GMC oxidoreductase-domain-containing protein [Suillus occidentalis]
MGHPEEVDVIIAGGGPAGCVVAGRLAYADPTLKVMLIEGGANNRDDPWVYRPGIYVKNMQRDGINDKATFYTDAQPSPYLRGRQSIVPYVDCHHHIDDFDNFQMYTRASASDWDDFKAEGWTAEDLLPLMKRLENYQKPVNNDTHGYDGPIAISNGGQVTPFAQDFLRAAHAVGVPFSDDIQDLTTAHGSEILAKYINRHTGRRSDAATAYVHGVMDIQSNLYLRANARVSRVIFEGTKAVGVAYVPSRNRANNAAVQEIIVRARKMVVLSSGTLGTPQILERSGVGSAGVLKQLDLKVVSDLPGVGEEYQDHYATLSIYRVSNESTTLDDFLRGDEQTQKEIFAEWEVSPEKARLSSNAIDAGFKIRPSKEELKEMGPEFNALWDKYFKDKPDKPVMFGSIVSAAYADHSLLPPGKYMTTFQYLEYPASRGKIHITSPSPYVEPFFDSGFMKNKADFAPIRWSYKKTREVARRMDAFRGELTSHHPHFHPASPAAARDIDIKTAKQMMPNGFTVGIHMGTWHKPGEAYDASKVHDEIKYTKEDDEAIDNWIADHVETTWHSLGKYPMKPRSEGGVVDHRLNVYGTQNLKCVDLSICPVNLGTSTYSSALLVGEKGADLICEDLGIKLRTPHAPVPHAPIPLGRPATQLVR